MVHADAFGYARQMAQNARSYGVVVLDPPKLILDREEISAGKRKYFDLNVLAMRLIDEGGLLVTCSCSGLLGPQEFLALLGAAAQRRTRSAAPGLDRGIARPPGRNRCFGRGLPQSCMATLGRQSAHARTTGSEWLSNPPHTNPKRQRVERCRQSN